MLMSFINKNTMQSVLFSNLKQLYDCEMYKSAIPVASLLNTMFQNDRSIAQPEIEYQMFLYTANALYAEHRFREASKRFEEALLMRKSMLRYMTNTRILAVEANNAQFSEVESRYRLALCYRKLGEPIIAVNTLEALPAKQRTAKVNLLLAQLLHYGRAANSAEAIAIYKEVLRQCPMTLTAIEALLELGVDGIEVNSLVMHAGCPAENISWLSSWIKGHAQMYSRRHLEAARTFQTINEMAELRQNPFILTEIGRAYYYYGNFAQAQQYLETVIMLSPHNMAAMMPLAVVLEYNQRVSELEKLCAPFTNLAECTSEHWFILGQCFYATGKLEKASSFTHKAISMDVRNVEAQLLRGKICLQLKRHKDAICFFRTAQCIANYRFEVYKGLFHCYVGLKRLKEAQTMCALAVRYFRNSPRSYVMFARTLFHSTNPVAKKSARKFVAKALEIDEHYAPAVALMAEVCQAEGDIDKAIELLNKQVVSYPHHKLFTMLGDMLTAQKDLNGALEYYTIALNMEPTYYRALEGVNALGRVSKENNDESKATDAEGDTPMTNANSTGEQTPPGTAERTSLGPIPPDEEWPIECDEPSTEVLAELSSPAMAQEDPESETFSDPLWQDVEADLTN